MLSLYSYVVQAEITDGIIDMLENETNPITFSCKAIGEPVPNISWYFNGELIDVSNASKYIISNSSNGTMVISLLTIMNTQSSDVGRYTCFTENIIGSNQSSGVLTVNGKNIYTTLMSFFILTYIMMTDAAEILEPLLDIVQKYIREGENITLRCIGVGHPPPLVQWTNLDGSLSDRASVTNMLMLTNEGNVTRVTADLIFTGVYRDDTGVYECLARNLLNDATRNVSLTVQCTYVANQY